MIQSSLHFNYIVLNKQSSLHFLLIKNAGCFLRSQTQTSINQTRIVRIFRQHKSEFECQFLHRVVIRQNFGTNLGETLFTRMANQPLHQHRANALTVQAACDADAKFAALSVRVGGVMRVCQWRVFVVVQQQGVFARIIGLA